MIALTPRELAAVVDGTLIAPSTGDADAAVDGTVETDSRRIGDGGIFVAMVGEHDDGHRFVDAAIASGAALVIAEREVTASVPVVVVADGTRALAALARHVVQVLRTEEDLTVIGVTGSNGKTTTKNLLHAVLSTAGPTVAPRGSFNNQIGAPLSMLRADRGTRFLVVEMGASAVGDIAYLVGIAMPDISIVLKVGLAHAGGFGGIEQTQRAKAEIVTGLPATATAVLNVDDSRVAAMAGMTEADVVTFGLDRSADVRATDVDLTIDGTGFTVTAGAESARVHLRILGEHHVMNALATIAAARRAGIALPTAVAALEGVARAERWRMELLRTPDGITVINDAYNASPDSTAAALKTLAQLTRESAALGTGRSIAVLGEMSELGDAAQEEHDRIGRLVVRLNIGQLIVVGYGARHIHNAAGLEGSWDGESLLVDSADDAYDLLTENLRPGDTVLVKSSNSAGLRFLGDRLAGVTA